MNEINGMKRPVAGNIVQVSRIIPGMNLYQKCGVVLKVLEFSFYLVAFGGDVTERLPYECLTVVEGGS